MRLKKLQDIIMFVPTIPTASLIPIIDSNDKSLIITDVRGELNPDDFAKFGYKIIEVTKKY